ncbi:hypothetical protein EBX31_06430 [bacterium]|nr:hypothetical protein [bacterium]
MIKYSVETKEIIDGLRRMRAAGLVGKKKAALIEIGVGLAARMKKNYLASGLRIRTGNLINSIRWELFSSRGIEGVSVGSFGVPYAAIHEFGYSGEVNVPGHTRDAYRVRAYEVRAHTIKEHTRVIKSAFGRPMTPRKITVKERLVKAHTVKGHMVKSHAVKPHTRYVDIKERAYLRRSLAADRQRILRIINQAYGFNP